MPLLRSSLFMLAALCGAASGSAREVPAAVPAPAIAAGRAAADAFFTDPSLGETRALVVMQDGKRIYERYAPGYGPGNRFISWSMAKSVTSTLVGALVADARLDLDAPAPVPEWRKTPGDPRAAISLRQLLHMASGLRHEETCPRVEGSDTNRALFSDKSGDILGHAVAAPLESQPGAIFEYSTLTTMILADIVQRTLAPGAATPAARRAATRAFIARRLSGPAGMSSLICEYDPKGTLLGGSFCHATARDWTSFGQLYLDSGVVAGRQVVSPAWVAFVRTPSPAEPGYGGQFWLNRARTGKDAALFPEQGPLDAYAAIGHLGQYVLVVPSKRLVVVRLGKTQDEVLQPVRTALGRLVNAYPNAPPPPR